MKYSSAIVIACLTGAPAALGAQLPNDLEQELAELCESVAQRRPLRPLDLDAWLTRPSEVLHALEKVLGDPRGRVREYGTRLVVELGSRTTDTPARRQAVERLWTMVESEDAAVFASALSGVSRFASGDFNDVLREGIAAEFEAHQDQAAWIRAVGAAGDAGSLGPLLQLAERGSDRVAHAAWLSAARLGDARAVERVTGWVRNTRDLARLGEDLVWTGQPHAIRRVAEVLHGTERMPGITPRAQGLPLAQYAAHAITRHLPDAPVAPKPTGAFSLEEIEVLKRWTKERYP